MANFDVRKILTVYGLISSFSTLLTPLSASIGYIALLIMRFLQGFAISMCFTSLGVITSQWATLKESGFFLATLSIGNSITMPVAGALCESSWGWSSLYYLLGLLTLISFVILYFFYRDDPVRHRSVSRQELSDIKLGKISNVSEVDGTNKKSTTKNVPYYAIFTDVISMGILLSITCIRCGFILFMLYGPVYMNKILKFDIKSTGISASLPYIISIVVIIFTGQLTDRINCIPRILTLKIFVTIASIVLALANISLVFLTSEYTSLATIAFILVVTFSGISFVGTVKSLQMESFFRNFLLDGWISQHYSGIMMVFMTVGACLTSIILPLLIAILTPDNTQAQWRVIFVGVSIIIVIGMILFNLTAEVEPRPWVKNSSTNKVHNKEIRILTNIENIFKNSSNL